MNDLNVCNHFCFMVVWEAGPVRIPLFPGVISAFAHFFSNLLVNRRLRRVAGDWLERC
jgi:hypothetical protein